MASSTSPVLLWTLRTALGDYLGCTQGLHLRYPKAIAERLEELPAIRKEVGDRMSGYPMSGSGAPPRQDWSEFARKAAPSQDVVLVLNAGSSSIKFAVYGIGSHGPDCLTHGEIEGIGTLPRFHARDASGTEIAGMPWAKDANFSVHKLIEALIDWIEQRFGRGRIRPLGTASCWVGSNTPHQYC